MNSPFLHPVDLQELDSRAVRLLESNDDEGMSQFMRDYGVSASRMHFDFSQGRENSLVQAMATYALADRFSVEITEWLTPEDLQAVRKANALSDDPAVCATGDYCDSTMAMAAAWGDMFTEDCDGDNDLHMALWNDAWAIAKANDFSTIQGRAPAYFPFSTWMTALTPVGNEGVSVVSEQAQAAPAVKDQTEQTYRVIGARPDKGFFEIEVVAINGLTAFGAAAKALQTAGESDDVEFFAAIPASSAFELPGESVVTLGTVLDPEQADVFGVSDEDNRPEPDSLGR